MDILNITEKPQIDETIQEYEYHSYEPIASTNLNNPGEIRLNIETQDLFTHPAESYLVFDGKLVKAADNAEYANVDVITLTNNAMMHLFSNIKYQLLGQEIESVFHPGQATTIHGLLKYPEDFQKSKGLNQLWMKDSHTAAHLQNNIGFAARQVMSFKSLTLKAHFHSEFHLNISLGSVMTTKKLSTVLSMN